VALKSELPEELREFLRKLDEQVGSGSGTFGGFAQVPRGLKP
jgi:hypothetical protein